MGQLQAVGKPLKAPATHECMAGAFLSVQTQNPRASRLDLENGLLIDDPQGQWLGPRRTELAQIFQHTTHIEGYQQLQTLVDYPPAVGKFLRRVSRVRIERLLYRIL